MMIAIYFWSPDAHAQACVGAYLCAEHMYTSSPKKTKQIDSSKTELSFVCCWFLEILQTFASYLLGFFFFHDC